tara:strand:- start:1440 stop:2066 length:627 start_codon:yes stop_codon:yes gene_type:complete
MLETIKPSLTTARLLGSLINYSRNKKTEEILNKLEQDGIELDKAKLEDPYYLASLIRTLDAIERAGSKAKMDRLKNIFVSLDSIGYIISNPDNYQEFLSIFSDLSDREISLIALLDKHKLPYVDQKIENSSKSGDYNQTSTQTKDWFNTRIECCKDLDIDIHMFDALVIRLMRTGFISTRAVMEDTAYYFSPLYRKMRDLISLEYHGT